jgi:beta-galactosidase
MDGLRGAVPLLDSLRLNIMRFRHLLLIPAVLGLALAHAHAAEIAIDASKPAAPPQPLPFATGGRSPDGHVLAINSRYLLRDGQPWFPVMGEFQYSRYPASEWEQEILKMKAGGVTIVSTYVFWIHHEEIEGHFDWSGQRDLRRFVELAGRHGMLVWVRVGPWDHGEVRNGGLPDWLLQRCATRESNPVYLKYVARFYGEIGRQLKGLFWKDGGPIAGVQIENEYHLRGPGKGEEHILTLKHLAQDTGMDAPFYTITGWDDAAVPSRDVIPVFGGYPDGFWYRSLTALPPSPTYFFSPIRCDENVDADLHSLRPDIDARFASYPFLTAEMAGGMELSYHRRPLMNADDIGALDVVKLGSGVVLYGNYMFHGGTNPEGKTTLQESQLTGYPNDLPQKTYDFQAPLGEFGQMHDSFRTLKSFNLFLKDWGPALAPMTAYFPDQSPNGKQDTETPRVAVRSDSRSGFIFVNNYQKDHPLPERTDFRVQLKLATGALIVPKQPIQIPSGAYTFWPVNLPLGPATLEYATAQPLCRLDDPDTVVFFEWPGVAAEFAFIAAKGLSIESPGATVRQESGRVYVSGITPGPQIAIAIHDAKGHRAQIVLLTREQARNLWKAPLAGRERLVLSPADLYFEANRINLGATDPASLTFGIFPALDREAPGFRRAGEDGIFQRYSTSVDPIRAEPILRQLAQAGHVSPVRMGKEVAMAPAEADFRNAARWSIRVPESKSDSTTDEFLRITYQGDVARLCAGDRLITDDFYHGAPWEIGLWRMSAADLERGLQLQILPLRQDAPIYLAAGAWPAVSNAQNASANRASESPKLGAFDPRIAQFQGGPTVGDGQTARLIDVKVVPYYRVSAELQP